MNVKVLKTDGLGLEALIEINGIKLTVMDSFSHFPQEYTSNGTPEFSYIVDENLTWEETFKGNKNKEKKLEQLKGWSYHGYGQILSLNPTIVDFGILKLDIGYLTNDDRVIGESVKVKIGRLDLSFTSP